MLGRKIRVMLTYLAVLEALLWILAWGGPALLHGGGTADRAFLADLFLRNPTHLQQVLVNAAFVHLLAYAALFAAWRSRRRKDARRRGDEPD